MNQALIDEIVTNVLAKLQQVAARPIVPSMPSVRPPGVVATVSVPNLQTMPDAVAASRSSTTDLHASALKVTVVELLAPIITAEVLERAVRPGQPLRIGRTSILTPSARDWLNSKRMTFSRQDRSLAMAAGTRGRWQVILQTVTPTVRALQDGLRRFSDSWKVELVGQPLEAAALAVSLINQAECDGVVVFTEQAELIACHSNRNDRVRAAVMHSSQQWEQVLRTLSANVVCISPLGRTFVELRNLLRDCAATRPMPPQAAQ